MLEKVLMHLKNWFFVEAWQGTVVIKNGSVELPFLKEGQYFRIFGSVFNDGLHQYPDGEGLFDETFNGIIWALAVPTQVVKLAAEIDEWQKKNSDASKSPYQSESFGGYTYTKASGTNGAVTWQDAFKDELNPYRKVREV